MVCVTFWPQFLLLLFLLRQSDAVSEHCSGLQNEISRLEQNIVKRITELEQWNEILEQFKTETHVTEAALRSVKFEEHAFKSKPPESEIVISSLKEKFQANDGLTETAKSLNQKAQQMCEEQNQLQATIDGLTKAYAANNQTVQELREKQKQLQMTIDGLTMMMEANNQTVNTLCKESQYACGDLIHAVESGDVNTARILASCTDDNCTTVYWPHYPPITLAATLGNLVMVRVLVEGGANLEMNNTDQQTALHEAVIFGNLNMTRLLLDLGANVEPVNKWKETPLHIAAQKGNLSVAQLLVLRGANVRLMDKFGKTASYWARINGKSAMANWLDSVRRV